MRDKIVLVIEDSPTQALHIKQLLEQEGVSVVVANDGRMGVEMTRQLHPDLVILDVQMPDIDGFQVCQRLKAINETEPIPIIMLTRRDDRQNALLGLQSGAVDYIPKDAFADAVLLETLRQMDFIDSE